ncbi:MAG: hypothetical protein AB1631_22700, partial [Acidobacteriota bacterium]
MEGASVNPWIRAVAKRMGTHAISARHKPVDCLRLCRSDVREVSDFPEALPLFLAAAPPSRFVSKPGSDRGEASARRSRMSFLPIARRAVGSPHIKAAQPLKTDRLLKV